MRVRSASESIVMKRLSLLVCILMAFATPWAILGAIQIRSTGSDVAMWLPQGRAERQQYDQFSQLFGQDQFLMVSWDDCRLDDPRLTDYTEALQRDRASRNQIRNVLSPREVIDRMRGESSELSEAEAARRLTGLLLGHQGRCAILVQLTEQGAQQQTEVIERLRVCADQTPGLGRPKLRFGGSAFDIVTVDQASERSLRSAAIPASLFATLAALAAIGNLRLTAIVLVLGTFCQVATVAVIHYLGGSLNAVLIVLPTLVFMLTVSAGVHLVNYYRDARRDGDADAAWKALRMGWRPCALATCTTCIGFGSLANGNLEPVQRFGSYSAIALLGSTLVTLIAFPSLCPRRNRENRGTTPSSAASPLDRFSPWGRGIREFILSHATPISLFGLVTLVLSGIGITRLQSTVKIEAMFPATSEINRNYRWLESNVGPLVSVEVMLTFPRDESADSLRRIKLLHDVHQAIVDVKETGGVHSAITYITAIPYQERGLAATIKRSAFRTRLESLKPELIDYGLFAQDAMHDYWRITAKVPAFDDLDYGPLADIVRQAGESVVAQSDEQVELHVTGLSPLCHQAQMLILSDLASSFLMTFALITPAMVLSLRNLRTGLVAMLPNLTPVVLVFGAMGWLGKPVDIASILTASVALGIAVDDTLHFMTWYARGIDQGMSLIDAVRSAYDKCAAAMIQTTLICCAAMSAFLTAEFLPTGNFAKLMILMLMAALVGDLVFLPAMLAGPLGARLNRAHKVRGDKAEDASFASYPASSGSTRQQES